MSPSVSGSILARRAFMRGSILASLGVLAAACGAPAAQPTTAPTSAPQAAPAAQPTTAPTSAPQAAPAAKPTAPAGAAPTTQVGAAPTTQASVAPTAQAGAKAAQPVKLVWHTYNAGGTPWPDHMTKSFTEKFPNVTVEYQPIPISTSQLEAYPKMYAMYAAGTLGDVFNFDPSQWEFYRAIGRGILLPIDDLIKGDSYDLTQFYEPFVNLQKWQGKVWGLPAWGWSGHDGIIYNALALREAGIAVPDHNAATWTMDTVYEHAVKLTKKGAGDRYDRFGINLSLSPIGATIIARAFGGDLLSPDGKEAAIAKPEATKAFRWIYDLAQKEKAVALPGGFQGNSTDLFASGKLAMMHAGSLTVFNVGKAITDPKLAELKAVLWPKRADGKRPSQLRGGTWNINARSPQPPSSWEFIKHITNRENMLLMNTEGGEGALTRPDIMNNPYFTQNENFKVYLENLLTALPAIVPANFRGFEYEDTFSQTHSELYLGKIDFAEGLKKMNDSVQRVLDKPAE